MQQQGIEIALRVAPSETPERYMRAFEVAGAVVPLAERVPIADAIAQHDLLICPFSSVALEASALGIPVLMCLPVMPAPFARSYLVTPWTESLPVCSTIRRSSSRLPRGLSARIPRPSRTGLELGSALSPYVQPFDADAFTNALRDLSA